MEHNSGIPTVRCQRLNDVFESSFDRMSDMLPYGNLVEIGEVATINGKLNEFDLEQICRTLGERAALGATRAGMLAHPKVEHWIWDGDGAITCAWYATGHTASRYEGDLLLSEISVGDHKSIGLFMRLSEAKLPIKK